MANSKSNKEETLNRLNELTNVVEKYTRTERHLEQHSNISSPEAIDKAYEKQAKREDEIHDLKNKIIYDDGGPTNDKYNLEKNYRLARGYINHNSEHMDKSDLKNLKEKQADREVQRRTLEWNRFN